MQWHALGGSSDGNSYSVVYHIPVPSANNRVGVNYRAALVNSGIGGKTQLPDGDGTGGTISSIEKASIIAGTLYEVRQDQNTNPGQTLAELKAILDANFAALSDVNGALIGNLKNQLAYFGGTSTA